MFESAARGGWKRPGPTATCKRAGKFSGCHAQAEADGGLERLCEALHLGSSKSAASASAALTPSLVTPLSGWLSLGMKEVLFFLPILACSCRGGEVVKMITN